ncbi:MAG: TilS substrate-binding domain-containing protein [Chromatiaceae bacterium]|nr:TilS substrate-binding domain-containing protein [Chromatiaceae bacterium]
MIRHQAALDLDHASRTAPGRLPVARLRDLPEARARNLLRLWLRGLGAAPLPAARLDEALSQLCSARPMHRCASRGTA